MCKLQSTLLYEAFKGSQVFVANWPVWKPESKRSKPVGWDQPIENIPIFCAVVCGSVSCGPWHAVAADRGRKLLPDLGHKSLHKKKRLKVNVNTLMLSYQ